MTYLKIDDLYSFVYYSYIALFTIHYSFLETYKRIVNSKID
jgi:hypothetical protein